MNYRTFGNTNLMVSEIGLGCSYLGGTLEQEYSMESIKILYYAYDQGINFFDTADIYSQGKSEEIIGKAFKNNRDKVIIATKVGYYLSTMGSIASRLKPIIRPFVRKFSGIRKSAQKIRSSQKQQNFSREYIMKAVENSLERLRTDYLDLLQLHNPPKELLERGDVFNTLDYLQKQGKIRYYGVSCRTVNDALNCLKYPNISSIQITVNLLEQEAIQCLLPHVRKQNIALIARQPLAGGILVGSHLTTKRLGYDEVSDDIQEKLKKAEKFQFLTKNGSKNMVQATFQFVLQLHGVSVAIVGTSKQQHLDEILNTLSVPELTYEELSKIYSIGTSANSDS
ncbi:MAG: aldo/keto reductase [Candidatus Dadabacteria bacterium CSP1-2]|nr:MAG: aldo/keto reductase [Candidatus Dadabacteria bacterium CSP1-2]